jgi:hypothetical protein
MKEREMLRALLRGKGAHVDTLGVFEGLTLQTAGESPKGAPHTVWQLLGHMIFWQDLALARIRGENPIPPAHAEHGWPFTPAPADRAPFRPRWIASRPVSPSSASSRAGPKVSTVADPEGDERARAHLHHHRAQLLSPGNAYVRDDPRLPRRGGETW